MTAAMIDSRDFIAAKRRAETEVHLPSGPKIVFSGGIDYTDHKRIWAVLDRILAKHSDMVLVHGGSSKGAEKAAASWANHRKVTQIAFQPDWTRDGKAAPFKRNDRMLEIMPAAVVVFPVPASPAISPTRPGSSAFPFSIIGKAALSAAFDQAAILKRSKPRVERSKVIPIVIVLLWRWSASEAIFCRYRTKLVVRNEVKSFQLTMLFPIQLQKL